VVGKQGDIVASLNTDTLRLQLNQLPLAGRWTIGLRSKSQAGFAQLLTDYGIEGDRIHERGFRANHFTLGPTASWTRGDHFFDATLDGARWTFRPMPVTSPDVVLPANTWNIEPKLRYTYWSLQYDPSHDEPHRTSLRINGFAAGVGVDAAVRSDARDFGNLEGTDGEVPDEVNRATRFPVLGTAWVMAGRSWERVRVGSKLTGAAGSRLDDVTRPLMGGMNPYVLPISGAAWGAYRPDAVAHGTGHVMLRLGESELGVAVDGAVMPSIAEFRDVRVDGVTGVWGTSIVADVRLGRWQLDARVGYAPHRAPLRTRPQLGGWLSIGAPLL